MKRGEDNKYNIPSPLLAATRELQLRNPSFHKKQLLCIVIVQEDTPTNLKIKEENYRAKSVCSDLAFISICSQICRPYDNKLEEIKFHI